YHHDEIAPAPDRTITLIEGLPAAEVRSSAVLTTVPNRAPVPTAAWTTRLHFFSWSKMSKPSSPQSSRVTGPIGAPEAARLPRRLSKRSPSPSDSICPSSIPQPFREPVRCRDRRKGSAMAPESNSGCLKRPNSVGQSLQIVWLLQNREPLQNSVLR